jgi:CheY-like chemotaxis protein
MRSTAVLVLGRHENRSLIETLFNMGFAALVRETLPEALDKLRHDRFAMIVVDRSHVDVDVLEFVLNVRDIDANIPVAVVGQRADGGQEDKILWAQPRTYLIDKLESPHRLAQYLERMLGVEMEPDS